MNLPVLPPLSRLYLDDHSAHGRVLKLHKSSVTPAHPRDQLRAQRSFLSFFEAKLGVLGFVRRFSDGSAKKGWSKLGMGRACNT
jgi:hypothetical protein